MENNPYTMEEKEALTRKLEELLGEWDNEENDKYCFQEEMIEEVMQELYKEITFSSTSHVLPKPPIFKIDTKNESCSALVSSSQSTIMAGIQAVASIHRFLVTDYEWTVLEKESGSKSLFESREKKKMEEFKDEDHLDCEWVGRVLRNWLF